MNSLTGAVTLTTSNIAEGTNLYFTNSRAVASTIGAPTLTNTAIASGDSLQVVAGKLQGQINAKEPEITSGTTAQYLRGDKTFVTLNTSVVPENGNLYFTNDRALASTIGVPTLTNTAIASGDSLQVVSGKLQGQINQKQDKIDASKVVSLSKVRIYGVNEINYVELSAGALTTNRILNFPDSNGTSGQFLSTDGAGNLSWASAAGGVTSVNSLTGAVTLSTSNISEGTNLYFTNARAIASIIGSPVIANDAIASGDTIQKAFGKLQGQFNSTLSLPLTGLSTATSTTITSSDTILSAFGKLQAQQSGKADSTNIAQTITAARVTGLSTPLSGSDAANKFYVDSLLENSSWTNTATANIYRSTGFVGIGTSSPGAELDVKGTIRLSGSTSGFTGFRAAASAGSTVWTLPTSDGTDNQVLATNGSGVLRWITASGGGGGVNTLTPSTQTGDFTITSSHSNYIFLVNPSAGTATATLPAITSVSPGFRVIIKRKGFGFVNIAAASGDSIEGVNTRTIDFQGGIAELMATTAGWELLRSASAVGSASLCNEGNMTFSSPGEANIPIDSNMVNHCKFAITIQGAGGGGTRGGAGGGVRFEWVPTQTGTLGLYVGGAGSSSGGGGIGGGGPACAYSTSYGGGGGGASAALFTGSASSLLAIAGGGGGQGATIGNGGTGGSGGSPGSSGSGTYPGGPGGNNVGGTPGYSISSSYKGGNGGSNAANGGATGSVCDYLAGGVGVSKYSIAGGGAGNGAITTSTKAGGGGAGYGGGAGGASTTGSSDSGGGGGGGYINSSLTTNIQSVAGSAANSNGRIIVVWTAK